MLNMGARGQILVGQQTGNITCCSFSLAVISFWSHPLVEMINFGHQHQSLSINSLLSHYHQSFLLCVCVLNFFLWLVD